MPLPPPAWLLLAAFAIPAFATSDAPAQEDPSGGRQSPAVGAADGESVDFDDAEAFNMLQFRSDSMRGNSVFKLPFAYSIMGPGGSLVARLILPVTDPCPKELIVQKGFLQYEKVPVEVRAEPAVGHGQFSLDDKVFNTMAGLNYTISSPHPAFNFADRVCDARVDSPSSAVTAYFALTRGRLSVPLPLASPCKIVVVGDTGLRIKSTNDGWCKEDMGKPETLYSAKTCPAENMTAEYDPTKVSGLFQSASKSIDPASNGWVWDKVAAEASWEVRKAQGKAVVLHVGDYTYRHEACPMPFPTELTPEQEETRRVFGDCTAVADHWGDTSEGWVADFFQPAVPLLRAAPWVVLRGNHETCKRGGMGWFRYLEPRPADSATFPGATSNHPWCVTETPPYSVDFLEEQWLVIDSSDVSNEDVSIDKTPEQAFSAEDAEAIAGKPVLPLGAKCEGEDSGKADLWMVSGLLDLVHPGKRHWIAVHRPVSGLTFESVKNAPNQLYSFQCELANTMNLANITIDNVPAIVSGHVHYFQLVQYQEGTAQIAVGNSGTQLKTPYNGEPLGLEQVAGTGATVLGDEVVNSPSVGQWGYAVLTTRPSGTPTMTAKFLSDASFQGAADVNAELPPRTFSIPGTGWRVV